MLIYNWNVSNLVIEYDGGLPDLYVQPPAPFVQHLVVCCAVLQLLWTISCWLSSSFRIQLLLPSSPAVQAVSGTLFTPHFQLLIDFCSLL